MTDLDRHAALLQEIRDNQEKQTAAVMRAMEGFSASQRAYIESQRTYAHSQEEYQKSQEAYRKTLTFRAAILVAILGVIALCMVASVILTVMGR